MQLHRALAAPSPPTQPPSQHCPHPQQVRLLFFGPGRCIRRAASILRCGGCRGRSPARFLCAALTLVESKGTARAFFARLHSVHVRPGTVHSSTRVWPLTGAACLSSGTWDITPPATCSNPLTPGLHTVNCGLGSRVQAGGVGVTLCDEPQQGSTSHVAQVSHPITRRPLGKVQEAAGARLSDLTSQRNRTSGGGGVRQRCRLSWSHADRWRDCMASLRVRRRYPSNVCSACPEQRNHLLPNNAATCCERLEVWVRWVPWVAHTQWHSG